MRTSHEIDPVHLPISTGFLTSAILAFVAVGAAIVLVVYFTIATSHTPGMSDRTPAERADVGPR
jgi:hypothetical protein